MKASVVFSDTLSDTKKGLAFSVAEIFDHFGGGKKILKESKDVYIKVNAVDLKKYCYTDPEVIRETILYFKAHGARNIFVIENCTQGNFSRLVFKGTGIYRVCKETETIPIYLDETGSVPIYLDTLQSFIDISDFVHKNLILEREKNLYISIPKLKTHSMSQVSLSIKNQFGLVHQASRIADHNFKLHQKFADIYKVLRPDFALIDGILATNHGHYIAEKYASECIVNTNCLIGGIDPLAVDVVASSFLGYDLESVTHLQLCAKCGIGVDDINDIEIVNKHLYNSRKQKLTHKLLQKFPSDINFLRGKERCCVEGCRSNTETLVEIFYADNNGKGGLTIIMGKGFDPKDIDNINEPVHIAGSCAIEECGQKLKQRLGKNMVTMSSGCNNLAASIHGICKQMKVHPLSLTKLNPISSLSALVTAKLKRTKAIIPPLL
ncbi:MAG: DUF362 domain-containing protein [Oligoflexia bacterium]|nr:DUF362 domain-containing protein [Oligoflexia bacterium]